VTERGRREHGEPEQEDGADPSDRGQPGGEGVAGGFEQLREPPGGGDGAERRGPDQQQPAAPDPVAEARRA